MSEQVIFEMKGICKSFPGVKALDGVNLAIRKGEVHALLGENGAGKSTLIKILGGIYKADEGEILVDGKRVHITDVKSAAACGVSVVHQELCLADNLTVAENIFVGRVPTKKPFGFVDRATMNREAHALCLEYGLDLDPETRLDELSIAQQQMVELAKAMSKDARIVVLDEPTGALTEKEIVKLFDVVKTLQNKGVSFVYISHRMEEIFKLADRATILRDGRYIGTVNVADIDYNRLVTMMIGREMKEMFAVPDTVPGDVMFEAKHITAGKRVLDCSFSVRKGEILGLYGLVGSGRSEMMRAICGIDHMDGGEVFLNGKKLHIKTPEDSIEAGISLVPENRKEEGLVLINTVGFNATMGIWKKLISGAHVQHAKERNIIETYVTKMAIKTPTIDTWVGTLSGGNQQKVVIAKSLATRPDILIMDEPTRGIDVGAKKEIYEIMCDLVREGVSIIMISSELPEIMNMCSRIVVMHEGRITGEVSGDEITEENIIIKATGGTANG